MLLPMVLAAALYALPRRRQVIHAAWFGIMATIALAPSLYYFFTAHKAFMFGNLEFQRLALHDPANTRIRKTMTWPRKLRYFVKEIVLPSRPIFTVFIATAIIPGWRWLRRREHGCNWRSPSLSCRFSSSVASRRPGINTSITSSSC